MRRNGILLKSLSDHPPTEKRSVRPKSIVLALGLLLVITPPISLAFGAAAVPLNEAFSIFALKLFGIGDISLWDPNRIAIIWLNRVPRIITAIAVGAILGVAGVAMQATIRNPLAEPYVLGISSGASAGAATAIVILGFSSAFSVGAVAFVGASITTLTVLWLGSRGSSSTLRLVLAGVAIGFAFQAATNLIIVNANSAETAQSVVFWNLGSLTRPDMHQALALCATAAILSVGLWVAGPYLDALASGDQTCIAIGLNPTVVRIVVLVPVSISIGVAVSQTGGIGFIGLVIPHIMRPLIGYSHRMLVLGTTLAAALFLLVTDTVARTLFSPVEIPIGIITALLGAPMLVLLTRKIA